LPFDGTTGKQLMLQHITVAPNLGSLPEDDQRVVGRALAKKPAERFSSCSAFVQALRDAPPVPVSGRGLAIPTVSDPEDTFGTATLGRLHAIKQPCVQAPCH
jgi:hypothetical protein